jgi:hypothetical protein
VGVGVLALALAGCDTSDLVDLQDPDLITGPVARDTANINELRNGVTFEFARALTGVASTNDSPGIVGLSGLLGDELWYASTFGDMQDIDKRDMQDLNNASLTTTYSRLHRARNLAEQAILQYQEVGRENSEDAALVRNVSGFVYVFFAEDFCSGVPVSTTALTGDLVYGQAQTTQELLDSATTRFQQALSAATAAGSSDQENLAKVGLGRVLLDAGKFDEAASAVADVPTDFVYTVEFSENTSSQNNGVWQNVNAERRSSAASGEGGNGIVFFKRGSPPPPNTIDERVPVDSIGTGLGTTVPFYTQLKYPTRGTGVPIASGVEARLIQAEALLNKGASSAYLAPLNELRDAAGLDALTDPGSATTRVQQFFKERAFFLWLTGHRLGDMRRLIRQYEFTQDQVFPEGQTIFGAPYGSDVNFPIPFQETNNPQDPQAQCIDRNA